MSFFFFFFLLLPLPTAGKGLFLKAGPRRLETATMLKKHSIMWLFGNVATASVRGAQLSALVNMFGAAAEQASVYKYSEKHVKVYLLKVNMKCKEIYHSKTHECFADISVSHAVHQKSLNVHLLCLHINFTHTLL